MANIELCASSISSIIDSNKFNIDRIELCSEIGIGGVTPSIGFVEESLKYSKVPIRVLIRPRSGNFVYDKNIDSLFALAIFDSIKNKIFITRDWPGRIPLYFFKDEKRFIFSSELKAFKAIKNRIRL